jgi:hypothetical protein
MTMASIRNLVPYEISVQATDLGSGKPVTNLFYMRSGADLGGVSPYDFPVLGPSSTATMLAAFKVLWEATVMTVLNANYKMKQYVMRAILGKRYGTPLIPISGMVTGTPVSISTAAPHGLSTGSQVSIQGVFTPAAVDANWTITVTTPTSFTLNGSAILGAWSGDGTVQLVSGKLEWLYADKETLVSAVVGSVAGDALPLFATASVRRLNSGIGRRFRSRFSLSPMSESDSVDGGFTVGRIAAINAAGVAFLVPILNGGTDADSKLMHHLACSKTTAFGLATPFTQSNTWTARVSAMTVQQNCGSLTRRKPRLTSIIV